MNSGPSIAAQFFRDLCERHTRNEAVNYLVSLVNSQPPTPEEDWLDFKGADKIPLDQVGRHWSEALSGFANTGGGVLLWSLDCRFNQQTKRDEVIGLALASDAAALQSKLTSLLHQMTDPLLTGVEFLIIPHGTGRQGFVACYIPEGEFKPYRAEIGKNYFIRSGTSFTQPARPLLRAMFFPHTQAKLKIYLRPSVRQHPVHRQWYFYVAGFLNNEGPGSAENVSVLWKPEGTIAVSFNLDWTESHSGYKGTLVYAKWPLHPGAMSPLLEFEFPHRKNKDDLNSIPPMQVRLTVYAHDQAAVDGQMLLTPEMMLTEERLRIDLGATPS